MQGGPSKSSLEKLANKVKQQAIGSAPQKLVPK